MPDLYDTDFVAWAEQQAALLTERRFDLLDLDHLIEEVEDLAGRHRDALESHLRVAMIHLLKLTYTQGSTDPERGWQRSVRDARIEARRCLRKYPSLRAHLERLLAEAYSDGAEDAHRQLADFGDTHAPFPEVVPVDGGAGARRGILAGALSAAVRKERFAPLPFFSDGKRKFLAIHQEYAPS